jgi:hypothetical protein
MHEIAPDGDCFFAATIYLVKKANPLLTVSSLREVVCNHMAEFKEEFEPFTVDVGNFQDKINYLRTPGHWNSEMGNAVPYAVANLFQTSMIIFSSRPGMEVVTIQPLLVDKSHPQFNMWTALQYAYVATPNNEHYNPCTPTNVDIVHVPVLNWDKDAVDEINNIITKADVTTTLFSSHRKTAQHGQKETIVRQEQGKNTVVIDMENKGHTRQDTITSGTGAKETNGAQQVVNGCKDQVVSSSNDKEKAPGGMDSVLDQTGTLDVMETDDDMHVTDRNNNTSSRKRKKCNNKVHQNEESHNVTSSEKDTADVELCSNESESMNKKKKRRKVKCPQKWKCNVDKNKKLLGLAYKTRKGKDVLAKTPASEIQPCKYKCAEHFNEIERGQIFADYWSLGDKLRKQDFLCSVIDAQEPKTLTRQTKGQQRYVTRHFYLELNGKREKVCKEHFMDILNIGSRVIETALKYKSGTGLSSHARPVQESHNRIPDTERDRIRDHIKSFPTMESHYCRKDSQKKYLEAKLNLHQMYLLYKAECNKSNVTAQKLHVYRSIFNTEFNIAFHKPKKDTCSFCEKAKLGQVSKEDYEKHLHKKEDARQEKMNDKETATNDSTIHAACFDLQQVLGIPKTSVGEFYYKRKLSCYNLSVYSLGTKAVSCYVWTENKGKRGACEIATCLLHYFSSLPKCITHVIMFCDCCGGQNRNKYMVTAWLYALQECPQLEVMDLKFLTTGHTQMEVDSVHAAIETRQKVVDVYVEHDWHNIIRLARLKDPYKVIPIENSTFIDFKAMNKVIVRNPKVNTDGEKINWLKICWLRFSKGANAVQYKYNFEDDFKYIPLIRKTTRNTADLPSQLDATALYQTEMPISANKKRDLLDLCNKGLIPQVYHTYYQSLNGENITDVVPEIEEFVSDDE